MSLVVIRRPARVRIETRDASPMLPALVVPRVRVETRDQRIAREVKREFQEARTRII